MAIEATDDALNSDTRPKHSIVFKVITWNSVNMKWNSYLAVVVLLLSAAGIHETRAATTPAMVNELKMSLNRLVRQQNIQLAHYKSQLESSTMSELREAVFALSEVFFQCTLSWQGLQTQFAAVDVGCASGAPHTPASIANEAATDLNQCLVEVEENVVGVTRPIDESLSAEIASSSKLNFWLQSKLFTSPSSSSLSPLDAFDALTSSLEIFNEAVLWDNVASIKLYQSVRAAPAALTNAGEWGFICGLNSFNKLFQKLKNTEAFLNTNCLATGNADAAVGQTKTSQDAVNNSVDNPSLPVATVKLVSRFSVA